MLFNSLTRGKGWCIWKPRNGTASLIDCCYRKQRKLIFECPLNHFRSGTPVCPQKMICKQWSYSPPGRCKGSASQARLIGSYWSFPPLPLQALFPPWKTHIIRSCSSMELLCKLSHDYRKSCFYPRLCEHNCYWHLVSMVRRVLPWPKLVFLVEVKIETW